MSAFLTSFRVWWIDFFLLATVLLTVALVALIVFRQPARRMVLARATVFGLWAMLAVSVLPGWPRMSLLPAGENVVRRTASAGESSTIVGVREDSRLREPANVVEESPNAAIGPAVVPSTPSVDLPSYGNAASTRGDSSLLLQAAALLSALYLAGAAAAGLWLLLGAVRAWWLCRRAAPSSAELNNLLARVVGHGRVPRLLTSDEISHAVAVGPLRPTIVLGSAMAAQSQRVYPVLAHEWAHVRHGDLRLLAGCRLLLPVLYLHPLYWLLRAAVRHNQETLADATVASHMNRRDYATELLHWARTAASHPTPGFSTSLGIWQPRSQLSRRVRLLLSDTLDVDLTCSRRWRGGAAVAAMALVIGLSLFTVNPMNVANADQPLSSSQTGAGEGIGDPEATGSYSDVAQSAAEARTRQKDVPTPSETRSRLRQFDRGFSAKETALADLNGAWEAEYIVRSGVMRPVSDFCDHYSWRFDCPRRIVMSDWGGKKGNGSYRTDQFVADPTVSPKQITIYGLSLLIQGTYKLEADRLEISSYGRIDLERGSKFTPVANPRKGSPRVVIGFRRKEAKRPPGNNAAARPSNRPKAVNIETLVVRLATDNDEPEVRRAIFLAMEWLSRNGETSPLKYIITNEDEFLSRVIDWMMENPEAVDNQFDRVLLQYANEIRQRRLQQQRHAFEISRWQGEWKVVRVEHRGDEISLESESNVPFPRNLGVDDGKLQADWSSGIKTSGKLTIDRGASRFDTTWPIANRGIYRIDGDRLTLCYNLSDAKYLPNEFRTTRETDRVLCVFERVKR